MPGKQWRDREVLDKLYNEKGLSMREIATELNCTYRTIYNWMERHDIERRTPFKERPPYVGHHDKGYLICKAVTTDGPKQVYIHRLNAVAWYGVESVKGKVVHHENEIPWDNREANLTIMTETEHNSHHAIKQDFGKEGAQ